MKGLRAKKVVFGVAWLVLASACSKTPPPPPDADDGPRRVAVMAPATAEILDVLGVLDRVVGIGQFGPWPASIAELPEVGGYDSPNVERLVILGTDVVFTVKSEAAAPAHRRLNKLRVRVVELDTSTYEGVFNSIKLLGDIFNRGKMAEKLAARMRVELQDVERRVYGVPRRRVLFVIGRDPEFVAGPGSHLDRLIEIAGGVNIGQDLTAPYQQMSKESILERQPEAIIDTSDNRANSLRGRQPGAWGVWDFLPAVKNNRVYWIDPSQLVIPGIRLPHMAQLMGKLIHPEIFGEPDPSDYLALEYDRDGAPN
ncbi:MAG: hypothetical protein A3H91_16805 [Gammaproteobacteria bacterium RIFCSPLOWO2_02_FULL_61_13]|nr:MAG: hypothetical protein A3H91_16805 [Gammaproteobacteria bacterium RIFCSPLOWO2_02_FULL_61_13]